MQRTASSRSRIHRRLIVGLLGITAAGALLVTPADASGWNLRFGRGYHGGPAYCHDRPAHNPRWQKAEFRRGYDFGATRGLSEGYKDGVGRRDFCDSHQCASGYSDAFRRGFSASYPKAYHKGFNFGRNSCTAHGF